MLSREALDPTADLNWELSMEIGAGGAWGYWMLLRSIYEIGLFSKDRFELEFADGALMYGDWPFAGDRPRGPMSEYAECGRGAGVWRAMELGVKWRFMDVPRSPGSFCSGYEFRATCPVGTKTELVSEELDWWWYWSCGTRCSVDSASSSSIRAGVLLCLRLERLEDDLEPELVPDTMVATCGCCICAAWPEVYPALLGISCTTGCLFSKA